METMQQTTIKLCERRIHCIEGGKKPTTNIFNKRRGGEDATQQQQLATALSQLKLLAGGAASGAAGGAARGGDGNRGARRGKPREQHLCVNCERMVYHKDEKCMELEINKDLRYPGWVSCKK